MVAGDTRPTVPRLVGSRLRCDFVHASATNAEHSDLAHFRLLSAGGALVMPTAHTWTGVVYRSSWKVYPPSYI